MKPCPRCGAAVKRDAWECAVCGSDISEFEDEEEDDE